MLSQLGFFHLAKDLDLMIYLYDRAFVRVAISIVMLAAGAAPASAAFVQYFQYLTDIGSGPGTAIGEVNAPSGVAAYVTSPTDHGIYVADTNNNRIQQVTFDAIGGPGFSIFAGATAGTTVGKVNQPRGIAVDLTGKVYVADTANNRIQQNTGGTPGGWSIVATPGTAIGQVNQPNGVAVDTAGQVYVADTLNNRIQINTDGTPSGWAIFAGATAGTAIGKVNQPRGIYIDATNQVYVADTANNRIQIATPSAGGFTWTVLNGPGIGLGQVSAPQGIAASAAQQLIFIADTGNNRIQMSTDAGGSWSILAGPGSGPGQVSSPRGLALADYTGDGRRDLIVADTGNNRVQVYAFVPEPSTLVLIGMAAAAFSLRRRQLPA